MTDISQIIRKQREFFASHQTKDVTFRITQLKKLRKAILDYEEQITQAAFADLHKSKEDAFVTEIGFSLECIKQVLKNIRKWNKPQKAKGSKLAPFTKGSVIYEPLGISLIIAPWNHPFNLIIGPLVYSMAAGNCAILKPSRTSAHMNQVIQGMVKNTFDEKYIAVTIQSNQEILLEKFDHICFTGSSNVGRKIMEAASKNLTPVLLELGGKSPCIVHRDADIEKAANRIVWGKFSNAGQTCIAPDYILVQKTVKTDLTQKFQNKVEKFYGREPGKSLDYGHIIDEENLKRLLSYLEGVHVISGGHYDLSNRYLSPTLIDRIPENAKVLQEEIFGPILPILEYEDIEDAIAFINRRPKPLALYIFTKSRAIQKKIVSETSSGGVTINDTLLHFTDKDLPFGGVGESGFGRYHGFAGFTAFSNQRSILSQTNLFDLPMRYPPGKPNSLKMVKRMFR